MRKLVFFIVFLFLLAGSVFGQEVQIVRDVVSSASAEEAINIKINVQNPFGEARTFSIREKLPNGIEMVNPSEPHENTFFNGIKASFLKWEKPISPGGVASFEYTLKFLSAGIHKKKNT